MSEARNKEVVDWLEQLEPSRKDHLLNIAASMLAESSQKDSIINVFLQGKENLIWDTFITEPTTNMLAAEFDIPNLENSQDAFVHLLNIAQQKTTVSERKSAVLEALGNDKNNQNVLLKGMFIAATRFYTESGSDIINPGYGYWAPPKNEGEMEGKLQSMLKKKQYISAIERAAAKTEHKNVVELLNAAVESPMFERYTEKVWHGCQIPVANAAIEQGVGFKFPGFMSTTKDVALAADFTAMKGAVFVIDPQQNGVGVSIEGISKAPIEKEVLFSSDTSFKVEKTYTIHIEDAGYPSEVKSNIAKKTFDLAVRAGRREPHVALRVTNAEMEAQNITGETDKQAESELSDIITQLKKKVLGNTEIKVVVLSPEESIQSVDKVNLVASASEPVSTPPVNQSAQDSNSLLGTAHQKLTLESNNPKHLKESRIAMTKLANKYETLDQLAVLTRNIVEEKDPVKSHHMCQKLLDLDTIKEIYMLNFDKTEAGREKNRLAKELNLPHIQKADALGLLANQTYLNLLTTSIREGKIDPDNVFKSLTGKIVSKNKKPEREDQITGYLFRIADYARHEPKLAYSVSELLKTIANKDTRKQKMMRDVLLAADSYKQGIFHSRPYHDFYGKMFSDGKEKNMTGGANVVADQLSESNLMPLAEEAKQISKTRAQKYIRAAVSAKKFIGTQQGQAILKKATIDIKTTENVMKNFDKNLKQSDIEQCITDEFSMIDELEKNKRISREWAKMESNVTSIVEQQWKLAMEQKRKELAPGNMAGIFAAVLGSEKDRIMARELTNAANNLPMTPPREVTAKVISDLRRDSEVSGYIKSVALSQHPSITVFEQHETSLLSGAHQRMNDVTTEHVGTKVSKVSKDAASKATQQTQLEINRLTEKAGREAAQQSEREAVRMANVASSKAAREASEKASKEAAREAVKIATREAEISAQRASDKAVREADKVAMRLVREATEKANRQAEAAVKKAQELAGKAIDNEIETRLKMLRAPDAPQDKVGLNLPNVPKHDPWKTSSRQTAGREAIAIKSDGSSVVKTIH